MMIPLTSLKKSFYMNLNSLIPNNQTPPEQPEVVDEDAETTEIPRDVPRRESSYFGEKRHLFTLDDILPSKWRERLMQFSSWLQSDS